MLDAKEVRQAIEYYNRAIDNNEKEAIELAPIESLESVVEDIITTARELSGLIDKAQAIWTKGNIQPVVTAAPTNSDYPVDSNYPKGWWLGTIIPQILALKTHFETKVSNVSPNDIFYAKPPKKE